MLLHLTLYVEEMESVGTATATKYDCEHCPFSQMHRLAFLNYRRLNRKLNEDLVLSNVGQTGSETSLESSVSLKVWRNKPRCGVPARQPRPRLRVPLVDAVAV